MALTTSLNTYYIVLLRIYEYNYYVIRRRSNPLVWVDRIYYSLVTAYKARPEPTGNGNGNANTYLLLRRLLGCCVLLVASYVLHNTLFGSNSVLHSPHGRHLACKTNSGDRLSIVICALRTCHILVSSY